MLGHYKKRKRTQNVVFESKIPSVNFCIRECIEDIPFLTACYLLNSCQLNFSMMKATVVNMF